MPTAPVGQAALVTPQAFWTQVLTDMGAPITQSNIDALQAWSEREGGGGAWNPLNTTRPMPGSTFFNHLSSGTGVQNYPNAAVGAQATAESINNGRYPSIVAAFKTGSAFEALVSGGKGSIGSQLRTWSGGGYNNINAGSANYVSPSLGAKNTGGSNQTLPSNSSNTGGAATGACQTLAESISGASSVASAIPGEQQIAGFFGWITQGCVQKRLLFQGAGLFLILYGLKFMGHSEPIKLMATPAGMVKGAL
jgi:hypothetical protein